MWSKKNLSNLLLLTFIGLLSFYVINNSGDFKVLLDVEIWILASVFGILCLQLFIGGLFIRATTNLFLKGDKLAVLESFYISVFSSVGNFFSFLQGGIGMRAVYLKEKYNLTYSDFTVTVLVHFMMLFFIFGSFGILGLLSLGETHCYIILPLLCISYGSIVLIILLNILSLDSSLQKIPFKFIRNILINLKSLPKVLVENNRLFLGLLSLYVFRFLLACLTQYLFFKALNIDIQLDNLFLYTSITGLSIIINLTPGSIGFREGLFILLGDSLDLTTIEILNLAILDRTMIVIVLVGLFFILRILRPKFSSV